MKCIEKYVSANWRDLDTGLWGGHVLGFGAHAPGRTDARARHQLAPVAEIGLQRLSIEAKPVGKSKRLPQVFRIVVSHERDKKTVQSMLDTLNCTYRMAGAEGFEPP